MKKIFALALVIVMMAAISVPAFAAEIKYSEHSGDDSAAKSFDSATVVEYGVTQTYTVTIPDRIVLNQALENGKRQGSDNIVVSNAAIAANVNLVLSVTSSKTATGDWVLKDKDSTGAADVKYTIDSKQTQIDVDGEINYPTVAKNGMILSVGSAVDFKAATATLTFTADKTMQVATYEDELTFTVTIVSKS